MDSLIIEGGNKLNGEIKISGAKNAALPLMASSLLLDNDFLELSSMPDLADTRSMKKLLQNLGINIQENKGNLLLKGKAMNFEADYDTVRKMRASILVLGPLLTKIGIAKVSLPGGCAIGTRPVDLHLRCMERLGASIHLENGYIEAKAPKGGLKGNRIVFPKISVGATENAVMACSLAKGVSTIINAAREPEVIDLCKCLKSMGAKIFGAGSSEIKIIGVKKLNSTKHKVISDRIEAGSFIIAAAMTGGSLLLKNVNPTHLQSLSECISHAGIFLKEYKNQIYVSASKRILPVNIKTREYPGFPTDLQAQFMTLMTIAEGNSIINETIFENRFMHVPELNRMGAKIFVNGGKAEISGIKNLTCAPLMATDLRASISLVIAALGAKGKSKISRIYHLDRGYENLEQKLSNCGAKIIREKSID